MLQGMDHISIQRARSIGHGPMLGKERTVTSLVNSHDDSRAGMLVCARFEEKISATDLCGGKKGEKVRSRESAADYQGQPAAHQQSSTDSGSHGTDCRRG